MKLHELSLKEQLNGLKEGSFSSSELTQHYLDRISSLDKDLNSFITVTPDLALNQAKDGRDHILNEMNSWFCKNISLED